MKASKLIVLLLSLSLVLALTACGGSSTSAGTASAEPASSDEGITVGGLWALTGFMADYEIPGSEGFELALEEINNNGGIDGHPVTYISYDSQSDVAQEHGVPTLATSSTLPYTQDRVGDTAFLVPYGDNIQAAAVAEYAYDELGVRTAYVVTDTTDEYTLALSKYFQSHFTALGGEILGESTYDSNGYTDFSASIQKVRALDTRPDALFFASFTDQGPTMLKQFRDSGLDQVVLSGDGLDSVEVAQVAGAAADNVYFSTHVDYTAGGAVSDFYEAYQDKYGSEPINAFAALGYDAAYLLKYAVENYAGGDYSPASIRDAIAQVTDFQGLTGAISYADGNVPNKTVFICKFENSDEVNVTSLVPTFTEEELAED